MATETKPKKQDASETATWRVKSGLAQMLKGGVIMDVVTPDQAKIAEDAGACAVCLLYTSGRCRRYSFCRSRSSPYH